MNEADSFKELKEFILPIIDEHPRLKRAEAVLMLTSNGEVREKALAYAELAKIGLAIAKVVDAVWQPRRRMGSGDQSDLFGYGKYPRLTVRVKRGAAPERVLLRTASWTDCVEHLAERKRGHAADAREITELEAHLSQLEHPMRVLGMNYADAEAWLAKNAPMVRASG